MKSVRALSGMPVVCEVTGKKIGRVKSVFVDKQLFGLTGLSVSKGFGRSAFYPGKSISLLGMRVVLISGGKSGEEMGETFSIRRAVNASGEMIGAMTNAYLGEETLKIEGLEISRDIFSDIARGRRICRRYTVNEETGDAVIFEEKE